jgi:DNA primase
MNYDKLEFVETVEELAAMATLKCRMKQAGPARSSAINANVVSTRWMA